MLIARNQREILKKIPILPAKMYTSIETQYMYDHKFPEFCCAV